VDTLVLGCTHYSFLIDVIQESAGRGVVTIDPAAAVAREVRRRIESAGLQRPPGSAADETFWSSGPLDRVNRVLETLWVPGTSARALPPEFCAIPLADSPTENVPENADTIRLSRS
jgi:glutamate racemase